MKKLVLIFVILILFAPSVFAGDLPETLLSDSTAIIFTGTVVSVTDKNVEVSVEKNIKGNVGKSVVLPYFEYAGKKENKPEKDDLCIVTILNDSLDFCFEVTSTNPAELKLKNHITNKDLSMSGISMDERFQEMVNNGTYQTKEAELPVATDEVPAKPITDKSPYTPQILLSIVCVLGLILLGRVAGKK